MRGLMRLLSNILIGAALVAAVSGIVAEEARADFSSPGYINLTQFSNSIAQYPNLQVGGDADFSWVTSGANKNDFSIVGTSTYTINQYQPDAKPPDNKTVTDGTININIKVNTSNWAVTSGINSSDLQITGSIDGTYSSPLLLGSVKSFQVNEVQSPANDYLEFYFNVTGGSMASVFGGDGATVGIYFTTSGNYYSLFGTKYSSTAIALDGAGRLAQESAVPLPGSIFMFLPGLAGLGLLRRWRSA